MEYRRALHSLLKAITQMRGVPPVWWKEKLNHLPHYDKQPFLQQWKSITVLHQHLSASQWNCCRHDEKLILAYTASHIQLPQNLFVSCKSMSSFSTPSFLQSFIEANLKRSFLGILGDIQQLVSCYYTCFFSSRDIIVLLKNISNEGIGVTDIIGKNLKCSIAHRRDVLLKLYI